MRDTMTDHKRERLTDVLFLQALPRVRHLSAQVAEAKLTGDLEMSRHLRTRLRRWENVRDRLAILLAEDDRRRLGQTPGSVAVA